jgi:kumamolisin
MDANRQNPDLVPLPGSERAAAADLREAGPVDPQQQLEVLLLLRHRATGELGADAADVAVVSDTLVARGLRLVSSDLPSRRVRVAGSAQDLSAAFGTSLEQVTSRRAD